MQRRNFIKCSFMTATGLILSPSLLKAGWESEWTPISELEQNFAKPPSSARPWVFWQWMNGHITKDGITLDLEAMKRMGIGGAICFNNAVGIPRGPVDYGSQAWMEATAHAVHEAQRLGLALALHNSPGYSGAGGPWITPEWSMQQLVWTETRVMSNGSIQVQLPRPFAKHHYYRDAFVLAYPSLPVEKGIMKDKLVRVLLNGREVDKSILTDANPETKVRLENESGADFAPGQSVHDTTSTSNRSKTGGAISSNNPSLVFEFVEAFEARALTLYRKAEIPKDLFDGPRDHPPLFRLESSQDGIHYQLIGTFRPPELREMDTPAALSFAAVRAKFYRISANGPSWVSEVELHNGPRLGGWPGKTNHTHGDVNGETQELTTDLVIRPDEVVDITNKMDEDGNLKWTTTSGAWTILRIGHTTTGEEPAAHPDSGKGLELDKFRKEALDIHFKHFLDKFIAYVKPFVGNGFKGLTVDSWEAGKQNWTHDFPSEFRNRKGYDITAWMPAMTGRIVGSIEKTERFLWDVRRTQADLLSDNFYGYFKDQSHQRGLEFYAEPYGDGNLDSLKIAQHLDIPMSEFWTRYIYGSDVTSKQAASAAHIYGKKVVAAEAFTAMPATSKWTDYPYSLKAEGDYFFSLGVNRLVFHTFVHQPYRSGKPGMTMGPFGMHIDRNNTWTEQAYGWINHIKRCQYLLQQGRAIVDLCYFKGDQPESGVPNIYTVLPKGYKGDIVGADALHSRFSIREGKIVLPDGMIYRLCMMAPLKSILPSTLSRLKALVAEGMILVVQNKPDGGYGANDAEVKTLIEELFGNLDGDKVRERDYGRGKLIWGKPLEEIFATLDLAPDFIYSSTNGDAAIHFFHRQLPEGDVYFIANHKRRLERITASFRLKGMKPELWDPQTGERTDGVIFSFSDGRTLLSIELEPAGALFVVFRKPGKEGYKSVLKEEKEIITAAPFPSVTKELYAEVRNNFTIALWAKPDTFAHGGRSMLFHAPPGEIIYGTGHAAVGLSAGQNAVRIYERSSGAARLVLEHIQSLEGWTHLAVMYRKGEPVLFINGKEVARGQRSGKIVHPGLQTSAAEEQFASYFEGNYTEPQLFRKDLSIAQIQDLYQKGIPRPGLPTPVDLKSKDGRLSMLFFENGYYRLISASVVKELGNIKGCAARDLTGTWMVKFPKGSGAPTLISLPSLISLHRHEEFGVRHFSGTASYTKAITVSSVDLLPGKRVFLDLGRVEVVAEVMVNERALGLLWKEPFRIDITEALREGSNTLQVKVTNLWPNRLIGDEHLPEENLYSEHNFIVKLPTWYVRNETKPAERITFSVWKTHRKTDPLLESGLLGPVTLITAVEKVIK